MGDSDNNDYETSSLCRFCASGALIPVHSLNKYRSDNVPILCYDCGEKCCWECFAKVQIPDGEVRCCGCLKLLPSTVEEINERLYTLAMTDKTSYPWAKYALAKRLLNEFRYEGVIIRSLFLPGTSEDVHKFSAPLEKGLLFHRMLTEAVDMEYAPAQILLGLCYLHMLTLNLEVDVDEERINDFDEFRKAKACFENARKNHHVSANLCLGNLYFLCGDSKERTLEYYESGAREGCDEAMYLAAMGYQERWLAKCSEGTMSLKIDTSERQSLLSHIEKSICFLTSAAERGRADSQIALATTLVNATRVKYFDVEIPGKSPIPTSMKWARRAMEYKAKTDYDAAVFKDASDFISTMNERLKTRCAGCEFIDEDGFKFRCSRCKSAYYCSHKCQKKHWRSGHKFDCVT